MKLISADIENFGKINKKHIDFNEDITIINEKNGWGKTTLATFIKVMLYGFKNTSSKDINKNERLKYKPWNNGNFGGNLIIEVEGKRYKIEGFFGKTQKEDEFTVTNLETNKVEKNFSEDFGEEIFKLDKESFEKSIYIPQQVVEAKISDDLKTKLTNLDTIQEDDMNKYKFAMKAIDDKLAELKKKIKLGEEEISRAEYQVKRCEQAEINYKNSVSGFEDLKQKQDIVAKEIEGFENKIKVYNEKQVKEEKKKRYKFLQNSLEIKNKEKEKVLKFFKKEDFSDEELEALNIEIEKQQNIHKSNAKLQKQIDELKLKEQYKKEENEKIELNEVKLGAAKIAIDIFLIVLGAVCLLKSIIGIAFILLGIVILCVQLNANSKEKKEYEKVKAQKDKLVQELEEIQNEIMRLGEEKENNNEDIFEFVNNYISDAENVNIEEQKYLQDIILNKMNFERVKKDFDNASEELAKFEKENNIEDLESEIHFEESKEELETKLKQSKRNRDILLHNLTSKEKEKEMFEAEMDEKSEYEEDLKNKQTAMEEITKKQGIILKTKELLAKAQENLSSKYLSKMDEGIKKYISKISENDEILKEINIDTELEVKIKGEGKDKILDYFSIGYKDLVGLCTRFALIDAIFEKEKPFIILDDPFVNLDKEKIENAMNLIKEISKDYQIIYFTCHESRGE